MTARDYEIASGPGRLEYGAPVGFITSIDGTKTEQPWHEIYRDRRILQGYATRYNKALIHDGKIKLLKPDAFDDWLQLNKPIRFLIAHDEEQLVSTTESNLQIHSDKYGIAFRLSFPNTPIGHKAQSFAAAKSHTGMSIGYGKAKSHVEEVDGISVEVITKAELYECSLCPEGAVKQAYAVLEYPEKCGSLSQDCADKKLLLDGDYVAVMRALTKLETNMARRA